VANIYQPERRFLALAPAAIILATAAWKELSDPLAPRRRLGVLSAFCVAFLVLRVAPTGIGQYLEIFHRSLFNPPDHLFRMQVPAALALAWVFRKTSLTPRLASTALGAALAAELILAATWIPRPTYVLKSSFAEIASLPYNGSLLTNTSASSIALGYQGCVRVFGPGIADGHVDPHFLYHLRIERTHARSFDSAFPVEYRVVIPVFPFLPPGSRLVKSLDAAPGIGGRPARLRHWLWMAPASAHMVSGQRCCSPP
jgi:hypothetical protein